MNLSPFALFLCWECRDLLPHVRIYVIPQESVVESGLSSFFSKCQRLTNLDVSENERLTGMPSFLSLPLSLNTLRIGGCYRLVAQSLIAIAKRCTNLISVVMNSIDTLNILDLNIFFASLPKYVFSSVVL
ncbi:unnamed protein product, partial [Gongylonema pulchrum]|uniref:F-box/LRR-repeat protein n=1 Tax=Gongylonema pulchrum TaxID=637853 RepID=A0A183D4A9_9BILA